MRNQKFKNKSPEKGRKTTPSLRSGRFSEGDGKCRTSLNSTPDFDHLTLDQGPTNERRAPRPPAVLGHPLLKDPVLVGRVAARSQAGRRLAVVRLGHRLQALVAARVEQGPVLREEQTTFPYRGDDDCVKGHAEHTWGWTCHSKASSNPVAWGVTFRNSNFWSGGTGLR